MDQTNQLQSPSDSPSPMPHFASQQPIEPATPKRKKKGLWIGIIAAIIVVLLAAGTVAGYFLWYQNPEKVVTDGLMNAIKAKSTTYTGVVMAESDKDNSFRLELSGKNKFSTGEVNAKATIVYRGEEMVLEGDAKVVDTGDLYVRFHNIEQLVGKLPLAEEGSKLEQMINAFVSKVSGQWVKISAEDLKQFNQTAGDAQQCMTDVYKRVEADNTMMSEVADLYRNNQFVLVAESLGSQDGSMGYRLELDEVKLRDFTNALNDTELYRQLRECDENVEAAKDVEINDDDIRTELWVSQWSHEITKLRITPIEKPEKGDYSLELLPNFNQDFTITPPESSLSLEELRNDIEALVEEAQRAAMEKTMSGQQTELPIAPNPTT